MATAQTAYYDFDQVSFTLGGIIPDGFAEDGGIEITYQEPTFSMIRGLDGKVTRSKTLSRTAQVKIHLMQTSQTNLLLGALLNLDRDNPNGAGVVPLWIRDRSGSALYKAAEAWLVGPPEVSFIGKASARVWTIDVSKLDRFEMGA